MKKLISLISAMGLGLTGVQGTMAVQSCGNNTKGWSDDSYKEYFTPGETSSKNSEAKGINNISSSTTGDNANWVIYDTDESTTLTMVKNGKIKVSYTPKGDENNITVLKDGEEINDQIVSVKKGDVITLNNNVVSHGSLIVQFNPDASNSKTAEFTLTINISNKCYSQFLVDGKKSTDGEEESIVNTFYPSSSNAGACNSDDSFSIGKDYVKIILKSEVTSVSVSFDDTTDSECIKGLRIGNNVDIVNSNKDGDDSNSVVEVLNDENQSGSYDFDSFGKEEDSSNKMVFIGYNPTNSTKENIENPKIHATIKIIIEGKAFYNLTINFTGEIIAPK